VLSVDVLLAKKETSVFGCFCNNLNFMLPCDIGVSFSWYLHELEYRVVNEFFLLLVALGARTQWYSVALQVFTSVPFWRNMLPPCSGLKLGGLLS
jgi:hypothetical protein